MMAKYHHNFLITNPDNIEKHPAYDAVHTIIYMVVNF